MLNPRVLARQEGTCLIYGRGDRCDIQDFPEVRNGEIANTNAPVMVGTLNIGVIQPEEFTHVVSPSFWARWRPCQIEGRSPRGRWMRYMSNFFSPSLKVVN